MLIQTMSKAEKRYFKLFASQHTRNGSNNYIKLFDAIDKQPEYNEVKLRRKFSKESFGKKLAATKYLLYELILKSLKNFHSGKTIDSRLNSLLEEVDVLFNKTLYKQSRKVLCKAKRIARESEKTFYLHRISQWEKTLCGYLFTPECKGKAETWLSESEAVTLKLQNEAQYLELAGKMRMFYEICLRKGGICNQKAALKIIKHPLLLEVESAMTFVSKLCFHEIHSIYARVNHNYHKAQRSLLKIAELWEQNPGMVKVYAEWYKRTTGDLVLCALNTGKFSNYFSLIGKLRTLPVKCEQETLKRELWVTMLEFGYYLHLGDLKQCEVLEKQIRQVHFRHKDKLSSVWLIWLYFQLTVYYFMIADYDKAIDGMNRVQDYEKTGLLPYVQVFCKLLRIPVHYELKNFHFLEYQLRSTQRYLNRRERNGTVEKTFLKFMKKSLGTVGTKNLQELFTELGQSLKDVESGSFSYLPLGDKAIKTWVNRKADKDILETSNFDQVAEILEF
ncbi:MAG: hypothetical protein AAF502_09875 [Bacteroidota bacterium]